MLLLLLQLLPDAKDNNYDTGCVVGFAVLLEETFLLVSILAKKAEKVAETGKLPSMKTILEGYLLATVIAIPMGLILGWFWAVRSTRIM